jgi:diacylglycerol kinase family enzyme
VGGDGIFHEFVNGLLSHAQWEQAKRLPLCHVAAGSGNGLAASLNALSPGMAVLCSLKNWSRPMDMLAIYHQRDYASPLQFSCYAHLSFTWAYIADVNLDAEPLRPIGPLRFDILAAWRLISSRLYSGRLSYLPADDTDAKLKAEALPLESPATELESAREPWDLQGKEGPGVKYIKASLLDIQQPESGWRTLPPAPYFYFTAHNVPHQTLLFNASPFSSMDDGTMDLIWKNEGGGRTLVPYMLDQTAGRHIRAPGVFHAKAKAFVLEPIHVESDKKRFMYHFSQNQETIWPLASSKWQQCRKLGKMSSDGENEYYGIIRAEVIPNLITTICPKDLDTTVFSARVDS